MSTRVYIVLESQGYWWIDLDGRARGPFYSRAEAVDGAQVLATMFDSASRAQIYAPGEDGRQHCVWFTHTSPFTADGKSLPAAS